MKKISSIILAISALASFSASANSITLQLLSGVNNAGGSAWAYQMIFANSDLENGDFITLHDFGPVTAQILPAGWSLSQSLLGSTPSQLSPVDSAGVLNATLTWGGGSAPQGTAVGPIFLLQSPYDLSNTDTIDYSTLDHVLAGLNAGDPSKVLSTVLGTRAPTVPDAGLTVGLLGSALLAVEGLRRRLSK